MKHRGSLSFKTLLAILLGLILVPTAIFGPALARKYDLPQWFSVRFFALTHAISMEEYPQKLLDLYDRDPDTKDFVLHYPLERGKPGDMDMADFEDTGKVPLFLQWDPRWGYLEYGEDVAGLTGCGPMCLAMAGYYVTRGDPRFRPDQVIDFAIREEYCAPGEGSYWALMDEGAQKLGLDAQEILPGRETIIGALEQGDLVILMMGPGDFTTEGHYILLAGIENNRLRVHDSNSRERSERLWRYSEIADQIQGAWAIGSEPLPPAEETVPAEGETT